MPRWAASTDINQAAMVASLEYIGFSVLLLHRAGDGIHYLAVGYQGVTLLVEVKMPGKDLTPKEKAVHKRFTGAQMVAREPGAVVRKMFDLVGRASYSTYDEDAIITPKIELARAVYDSEMAKLKINGA